MTGKYKNIATWLLLLWLLIGGHAARAEEASITQGLSAYAAAMEAKDRNLRLQNFARAEQLFQQAVDEQLQTVGVASTELLVNLGNAALQAEHLGTAIVAYRRALLQQPSHQRARQNLQFARGLLPESVRFDQTTQLVETLFFWRSLISQTQLQLLAGVCFLLAAAALALSVVSSLPGVRIIALAMGAVWSVLLVSMWWDHSDPQSAAVVVVDGAALYSADSENAPLRLADPLPEGTEVQVLERRERWLEIEVAGRTGWITTSHVEFIAASAGDGK